ncbi:type I-E CRISPR-associated protein Cas6/Cse3/CasE [Yinghuangia sp. ASG 101]|uniref:type I-E CRISPR-associated protein Cas6/Cse3/CasE n=1 Tax=Yinghuangia sp. ASG 101 TaxID=2896848 RepID=UPI001E35B7E0|nr:type I-E CRISPR-associated protein Cas6/Cse3/CasE [Yinghuangia sp. ASG 101]UGQ10913.1 type I-E CRISPR-associated protein Cas6/Cse3/CasE [Yinghuangia sp. ASG 101]
MTYLSRIRINPLRADSRKLLANPRAMHGMVTGGVADRPLDERVLWRLDTDNPRRPQLYVLTQSKPDWTHAVESAGWPDADGDHALVRDYTPLLAQLAVGRRFAFRLTANPVQNTRTPQKPSPGQQAHRDADPRGRSFRIGHRTATAQMRWFLDHTDRWGFTIPDSRTDQPAPGLEPAAPADGKPLAPKEVRITDRQRKTFTKGGDKPVVLHTATFEGVLRITDTDTFTTRLLHGIGPAKAYGCGLLTLAPLHRSATES